MHEVLLWTGVMGWSEVYGTGSEQRPTQVTLWQASTADHRVKKTKQMKALQTCGRMSQFQALFFMGDINQCDICWAGSSSAQVIQVSGVGQGQFPDISAGQAEQKGVLMDLLLKSKEEMVGVVMVSGSHGETKRWQNLRSCERGER